MNNLREQIWLPTGATLVLLTFLCCNFTFGQNKADILAQLNETRGRAKVDLYIELSKACSPQSDSSFHYAELAFQLGYEVNYPDGMITALKEISRLQYLNKEYIKTIKTSTRAIQVTEHYDLDSINLGQLHFQIGRAMEELGAYTEANYHRKEQLKWKLKAPNATKEDLNLYYLKNRIALNFLMLEELDSALVYFKDALEVAKVVEDFRVIGHAYNDIGLCFVEKNNIDSASHYYQLAHAQFQEVSEKMGRDSLMIGIIQGNMARFIPFDDPKKQEYLQHNIDWGKPHKPANQLARAYLKMAEFHSDRDRYSTAITYLDSANLFLNGLDPGIDHLVLYKAYVDCYAKSGKPELAIENFENYVALNDSLYGRKAFYASLQRRSSYELLMIESELLIEQYEVTAGERKIELLRQEKEISQLKIYLLISSVLLLLTLATIIILRMRAIAIKKRKRQEQENQILERDIEDRDERLTQSVMGLKRKSDFAEELIKKIAALDSIDTREKQMLKLFIENELSIDTSTLEMEKYIHETGKDFFPRLKLAHPDLTENEIKLIALIKMNLTIKQIAIIKNITPNSVKVAKNRLRKKLNLGPGASISDYLDKI